MTESEQLIVANQVAIIEALTYLIPNPSWEGKLNEQLKESNEALLRAQVAVDLRPDQA